MHLIPRTSNTKRTVAHVATLELPPATLTHDAAAQAMWLYYRDHKLQLINDIRDHRASILAQLMAGLPVDDVFTPYFKPAAPVSATRLAA